MGFQQVKYGKIRPYENVLRSFALIYFLNVTFVNSEIIKTEVQGMKIINQK